MLVMTRVMPVCPVCAVVTPVNHSILVTSEGERVHITDPWLALFQPA